MTSPIPLSAATAILLADGWHDLASGTLGAVIDPSFTDPVTGEVITPGDTWLQMTGTDGVTYACPMRAVAAVKLAAPVGG